MAVPWWTLAKAVPWSDVIEHAPAVVNAARKLLKRKPVEDAGRPAGEGGAGVTVPVPDAATPLTPAELTTQLHAARTEAAQLRTQLTDTQQLLQELAEQQARALAQVEDHRVQLERLRRRLRAVAVVAVVSAVLVVGLLVKVLG
jgi:hypothetical protein